MPSPRPMALRYSPSTSLVRSQRIGTSNRPHQTPTLALTLMQADRGFKLAEPNPNLHTTAANGDLQQALAKGAVASADAERAETVAHGEAKAVRIRAEADAEAEKIRAQGAKDAADLLSSNDVAVQLARIGKTGDALQGKGTNTLFFGSDASNLGSLMANPAVVRAGV